MVFALHLVLSAFVAGPTPRYAVPVQPILGLFAVGGMHASLRGVAFLVARSRPSGCAAGFRPSSA
jgi:hypothetical protein